MTILPFRRDRVATVFVLNDLSCLSSSRLTSSANFLESVTKYTCASESCSACARRSAAINLGFAVESAIIRSSVGPAIKSIPTTPYTSVFASRTDNFFDLGDGFRPVGHRADCLRPTDGENPGCPCKGRCGDGHWLDVRGA